MKRLIVIVMLLFAGTAFAAQSETSLKIGVLAYRPKPLALAQWQPLATYLQATLKHPVELAVYDYTELAAAVTRRSVDVVITTASNFVLLKHTCGLSAPLATLVSRTGTHELGTYGGVIIARADRSDITSLKDLSDKKIAIVSTDAFGGFQMQKFEMVEAGVPLPSRERLLVTGQPHDRVIEAVLAGRADAGFIRAGVIESLVREGTLDPGRMKIVNRQDFPDFPLAVSTRLYPEWPVAVMPHVDTELASRLAAALFLIPHDHFKGHAAEIRDFVVPANYDGVEKLLRRLRLPPFDHAPEISLADLWRRYAVWIVTLALLLLLPAAVVFHDIIRRKRAEEMLHLINEELELRVGERTALLLQKTEELEQANERLKEVDRLKSQFLASMSHELRTPLNSIIGFSTILHGEWLGPVSSEQKQNLASIQGSGKLLLSMISDILDVTQIDSGTITPHIEEFDLHELFAEAESLIMPAMRKKGVALLSETPRQLMRTDRRWLLQCVQNMLSNAAKFTDEGSVTVEARIISSSGESAAEEMVEITVSDSGIGIAEGDVPKIFQPFSRIVTPGRTIVPGTGLGLFLSKKIATAILKGDLFVVSEQGKGSRFSLKIPVRLA